jgi:ribosomal protein L37AE/L43A
MKVTSFGARRVPVDEVLPTGSRVDVMLCTRCGKAWGYEIVEQFELWSCDHCGYEVRERSADHDAMLDATQESMSS